MTAVNFLTNPNVHRSSINQKQRFLRNKGLTEHEIQIACERAGIFTGSRKSTMTPPHQPVTVNMDNMQMWKHPASVFTRVKEVLNSVAVFSGIAYLLYKFYRKFIVPWLFGSDDSKKSVEHKLDQLTIKVETDMKLIGQEVSRVREDIVHMNDIDLRREMHNFKADLEAIKGLLLNKKQFASPNLPIVPPSIPSWQLKARHDSENDKIDDAGSGSGSSETEIVTKNSDSSLEIM